MANIIDINVDRRLAQFFNISGVVGRGMKNEMQDVRLIQALFTIVHELDGVLGPRSEYEKWDRNSDITGFFDEKTAKAIWHFQRKWADRLLGIDGTIHPASNKVRNLKNAHTARLMTITLLNMEAWRAADIYNSETLPAAVRRVSPIIHLIATPMLTT